MVIHFSLARVWCCLHRTNNSIFLWLSLFWSLLRNIKRGNFYIICTTSSYFMGLFFWHNWHICTIKVANKDSLIISVLTVRLLWGDSDLSYGQNKPFLASSFSSFYRNTDSLLSAELEMYLQDRLTGRLCLAVREETVRPARTHRRAALTGTAMFSAAAAAAAATVHMLFSFCLLMTSRRAPPLPPAGLERNCIPTHIHWDRAARGVHTSAPGTETSVSKLWSVSVKPGHLSHITSDPQPHRVQSYIQGILRQHF